MVDPSESAPVLAKLAEVDCKLVAIWNTHHHFDHVGGNEELCAKYPGIEVCAHQSDKGRVPAQTVFAEQDSTVSFGRHEARVLENPGHTTGAVSYYLEEDGMVFTGDTLFAAGCGRVFEGTPEQMHQSLQMLSSLPEEVKIFCGHEYTEANLRFGLAVDPNNAHAQKRLDAVKKQRARGESTMGFTVAEERQTNVFVRTSDEAVLRAARENAESELKDEAEVFAALRKWKDGFRS